MENDNIVDENGVWNLVNVMEFNMEWRLWNRNGHRQDRYNINNTIGM